MYANSSNLSPYFSFIKYDKNESFKNEANIMGVHTSSGNLNYLFEVDYAKTDITYKDETIENLNQDDISISYGKYFSNFMFRVGIHYINTNDTQLGSAYIALGEIGGYNYFAYDKISYGVECYYSYFDKGHDESYNEKSVGITQTSPYISYYKAFNLNWGNTFVARYNYQSAKDYVQQSYSSFEISDTIFYKQAFLTLKGYSGEMRTGVKDSGFTVINTLDLMKDGYSAMIGVSVLNNKKRREKIIFSSEVEINNYIEYGKVKNGESTALVFSANLIF